LFSGNLPDGAGLSSSAALLVLTAFVLCKIEGTIEIARPELAKLCQRVENEFIGVNCGIMDQFSIAMGRQDHAILLDCETLSYQYIPFVLGDYSLIIMNTNKKRELTESKYNERRSECEQALQLLQCHRPITHLCQVTPEEVRKFIKDEILQRRARHAVSENNRVLAAVKLLERGDIHSFGRLLTESHISLKNDYEVSGMELDAIVESALKAEGCIGARMTGAGFGGCAIALVQRNKIEKFKAVVGTEYHKNTGRIPAFFEAGIADGVKLLAD
jgi:galactokinase